MKAAGFLITAPTGRILLLLRADNGGSAGVWSIPGGNIEHGESPLDAARRELEEETGYAGPLEVRGRHSFDGRYLTYFADAPDEFEVELDDEHVDAGWFETDDLPVPTHIGVKRGLAGGPYA